MFRIPIKEYIHLYQLKIFITLSYSSECAIIIPSLLDTDIFMNILITKHKKKKERLETMQPLLQAIFMLTMTDL